MYIINKKELENYKEFVLEPIVYNVKKSCEQSNKDLVKKLFFEQASTKQDIPDNKRKIMFKLYKMLKYDLDYSDVEDEEPMEKDKENVVDPVNDYILKKNYTSKSLTCNKLKRKILNSALKQQKRADKIIAKNKEEKTFEEEAGASVISTGLENENENSSSDEEYIIQMPKAKSTHPNKETHEVKSDKKSLDKSPKITPQDKTPEKIKSPKQNPTASPKSELKESKKEPTSSPKTTSNKKKTEEIPKLEIEAAVSNKTASPKTKTKESNILNTPVSDKKTEKKFKTVIIDEDEQVEKKSTKSPKKLKALIEEEDEEDYVHPLRGSKLDAMTKTKVVKNKDDSFEEYSDNEEEDFYSDDEEQEGEEMEDDEEYTQEELRQLGQEILKKYMRLKKAKANNTLTPEEEEELDDEMYEYLEDDFDFAMNKPAYEEEDEQDDEGNDSKLNESLRFAYLQSQKNISINNKVKVNLLGKKRNFGTSLNINENSNKKKKSDVTPVKANRNKTKVNFRIGMNNFNGRHSLYLFMLI